MTDPRFSLREIQQLKVHSEILSSSGNKLEVEGTH